MELEEMKNLWDQDQNNPFMDLTIANLNEIEAFDSRLNKFRLAEIYGLVLAYGFALFILYNFKVLENWYLKTSGVLIITYLFSMPVYTLQKIRKMRNVKIADSNYKQLLAHFNTYKNELRNAEKLSILASPFLLVALMIVLTKILLNKNIFQEFDKSFTIIVFGLAFAVSIFIQLYSFRIRRTEFNSIENNFED